MIVKCVNNKGNRRLTEGKEYTVKGIMLVIDDDFNCESLIHGKRFEIPLEDTERIFIEPTSFLDGLLKTTML